MPTIFYQDKTALEYLMSYYTDVGVQKLETIFHLLKGYVVVLRRRKGNDYTDIRRQKCSNLEGNVQKLEQYVGLVINILY